MPGLLKPRRLHLSGTLLPAAEPVDLWVVDGLLRTEPAAASPDTIAISGWIMPGLVDAHCHVGLDAGRRRDRADGRGAGARRPRRRRALLLRDAGSPSDTRWIDDRRDLPRIIRAGRHIARPKRYLRNYADEVEPDDLVAAVERQAAARRRLGQAGRRLDRPRASATWPRCGRPTVAAAAIARAHELGARVTAHVFGEQATAELVARRHRRHRARHRADRRHASR